MAFDREKRARNLAELRRRQVLDEASLSPTERLAQAEELLARFAEELARPCALIGGIAVIARVFVRATKDIDLLVMKLEANRPIDLDDVIAIKDAFGDRLDLAYVRAQADRRGQDVRHRLDLLLS
jgi:hypothetical protein